MWWVLTSLQKLPTSHSLRIYASTNIADHLSMAWAYHCPSRKPIYIRVRGTLKQCGYKYIWDTPNIEDQTEPSDTLSHSWLLETLTSGATIWFYLWAPAGPYGLEIQSPLFFVRLTKIMVPTARVYRNTALTIPNNTWTVVPFQAQLWDTDNLWSLSPNPSRFTINTAGVYLIIFNARWQPASAGRRLLQLMLNGATWIARTEIGSTADATAEPTQIVTTIYDLALGDYIEAQVYHSRGSPLDLPVGWPQGPLYMISKLG